MQDSAKEVIRKLLKSKINVSYRIKSLQKNNNTMVKELFTETLDTLKEIEDRRDFMAEEIGMDMTFYEDKFFKVIENLLYIHFNESQLEIIKLYLYELQPDSDWDGKITIEKNKQQQELPFETSEDVWNVIELFN